MRDVSLARSRYAIRLRPTQRAGSEVLAMSQCMAPAGLRRWPVAILARSVMRSSVVHALDDLSCIRFSTFVRRGFRSLPCVVLVGCVRFLSLASLCLNFSLSVPRIFRFTIPTQLSYLVHNM